MSIKQSFTIVGEQWINRDDQQSFNYTFEYEANPESESKNKALSRLLVQPWRILSEGKNLGVKGVLKFVFLLALFGLLNLYFIAESWYEALFKDAIVSRDILYATLSVVVGLLMLLAVVYLCYRYLMIEVMSTLYNNNTGFFKSFCGLMVDKAGIVIKQNSNVSNDEFLQNMDFTDDLKSKSKGLPQNLKRVAVFIASRVPMMDALNMLLSDIKNDNRETVKDNLYQRMDAFLKEEVFEANSTNWVFLLLPVNLILQIIVLAGIS